MTVLRYLSYVAALAATVGYTFAANGYELFIIATVGLYALVGIGLNILLGLTGQFSLGHVGFYAIGAYTVAILTTTAGLDFWMALPAAMVITGLVGTILAIPALRVTGPYLAMVTIAFGFIIEQGAIEWRGLTGGANGMMNIPAPELFGITFSDRGVTLLVIAWTTLVLILFARFASSAWGLAMRAVRDSEVAGQSLGLNPVAIRTMAFTLSAVAAGIAGALFAPLTAFVSPSSFSFFQSILFLLVVIIGGSGSVLGPLIGAFVVVLLPEFLAGFEEYRLLFFGALLLLVMWLAPDGVVGAITGRLKRADARAPAADDFDVAAFLSRHAQKDELQVEDLSISFGGVQAVSHVSFTAAAGRITSLIGPNGAGKTTVFNMVGGFYKPDAGTVRLADHDLAGKASHLIARAGIARTYQTTQLFTGLTVLDNLLIALRHGQLGGALEALMDIRRDNAARQTAHALLAFVGYRGSLESLAGRLAHVDKRLVEIARALATQPRVLLLDEPAAGLGVEDTKRLTGLLRRIAEAGLIVVLVEHDMKVVMGVSDRVIVLDAGVVIAAGSPAEVRSDSKVREAYLGSGVVTDRSRKMALGERLEPVIKVSKVNAGYGPVPVLHEADLQVNAGELVAVLGANGAGKSTLMRVLSGLHRPVEGKILFLGQEITRWSAHRISSSGLALVPEGRQVFPELSVRDNIRLGAYTRADYDDASETEAMLERFPALRARQHLRAGLLSGGEQQMLAIARGLVAKPKVLMLDEPSLGLAPALIENLFSVLAQFRDEGITILLVDQMAGLALSVADRGYVLESGRMVHHGYAAELKDDPAIEAAYLGGSDRRLHDS